MGEMIVGIEVERRPPTAFGREGDSRGRGFSSSRSTVLLHPRSMIGDRFSEYAETTDIVRCAFTLMFPPRTKRKRYKTFGKLHVSSPGNPRPSPRPSAAHEHGLGASVANHGKCQIRGELGR